ncbi:MAG TPA: polysaccharide deacetylase family protein, partial [Saprospiraceae bacterium]|nr:polysaccharide deacetylase family protein [Saprospiraceae bacterium]
MYLVKTPKIIQTLRPAFLWRMPPEEKVLYLTFDDGPIPEVTPWVLDLLDRYSATATFFCVGDNVRKHHDIY